MSIAVTLHLLATVVWVGGMFFSWMILRPASMALEPPERLALWSGVLSRFFKWVWVVVIALPVTGYWIIFGMFGGLANVGLYVSLMTYIAYVMIALFLFAFFVPYPRFKAAVARADVPAAAGHMTLIRRLVATNLMLGLTATVLGTAGPYYLF